MHQLPLNQQQKHEEWTNITHIAKSNGYPISIINKLNTQILNKTRTPPTEQHNKKWITFTYHNPTIRKITNLFRKSNLKIAFTTHNSISNKLNTQPHHIDQYTKNGIYKLTCKTCQKSYIGQSGRKIAIRYKKHIRYIKYNNSQSAYANHILQNNHEYGPIEQSMELLWKENKGKKMNTWENYYIQYFTYHNNIIEEQTCAKRNPLFQLVYSIQSLHHIPDSQPHQSLDRHRTGRQQPQ
jgi:organic radical activating enzyme